jgi:hypothetical protein
MMNYMNNANFLFLVAGLSLVATILNIYKNRASFIIWAGTNLFWGIYDWRLGAREQAGLFFAYFLMALWGLIRWTAKKEADDE